MMRKGSNTRHSEYIRARKGMAKQSYIDMEGVRYLICYTSKKNAKQTRAGDDWNIAPTKDILNNFFNKDVIAGIIFNLGLKNMVLVLKPMLEAIMPGEKEKPPFFRGPK